MFLKRDHRMFGDMSGVMGLSGDSVGSVIISLRMTLAARIVSTMLGVDTNALEAGDITDGIGEFINVISGQAKTRLAETEYRFKISLPSVVSGHGHEIAHQKHVPCIVIVFKSDDDEFALQISLVPRSQ
ncbi:chemotaxis protein CheX [Candidatus Hydrogenedentota bacterium]